MDVILDTFDSSNEVKLRIHYRDEEVKELYKNSGVQTDGSAGFDLVTVEDINGDENTPLIMAKLGVVIKLPAGFHSILLPRSSTFKKFGIQQGNSIGLIDNDYCGKDDYLGFCIYDTLRKERNLFIPRGTRVCQLMVMPTIRIADVTEFDPEDQSRGGWGVTGQ